MNKMFGLAIRQRVHWGVSRQRGASIYLKRAIIMAGLAMLVSSMACMQPATAITIGGAGTCSVNTTAVHFGLYWGNAPLVSTGSITPSCSNSNTAVRISLNGGGSGQPTYRYLRSGAHTITYNLYTDAGHTQIWGDGTAGTVQVNMTVGAAQLSRQVYALAPAGQTVAPGSYTDTVLVTVIW